MRNIRLALIFALIVTSVLFGWMQMRKAISGQSDCPVLSCPEDVLEISVYQDQTVLLNGVQAFDDQDGDLTDQIMIAGVSKLISEDTAKVTYIVFDSDDNMSSCERLVRYRDYHRPRIYADEALVYSSMNVINLGKGLRAQDSLDGNLSEQIRVSTLNSTEESDVYRIVAQVTNSMGDNRRVELPVIIQSDDEARPVIQLKTYIVYLDRGEEFSPKEYIRSVSDYRQSYSVSNVEILSDVDVDRPGNYWVKYQFIQDGKISKAILTVVVQ